MEFEFKAEEKMRLDKFLLEKLSEQDISRSHIKNLIEEGCVLVNGKAQRAGYPLRIGQVVSVTMPQLKPLDAQPEDIDFEIVYEDQDLLVINKPQGLVVHPCSSTRSGTLVNGLLARVKNLSGINGVLRPGIVHRLDKNTSGLMLVAKNDVAHRSLAEQIKNKTCQRKYIALLEGRLSEGGKISTYLARDPHDRKKFAVSQSGKFAESEYRILKRFWQFTLVEFKLSTGRTHQIRVHAKYIGHPVVGDEVYGHADKRLAGQLLHSYSISFEHPTTKERMSFEAKLPDYFDEFLSHLKTLED